MTKNKKLLRTKWPKQKNLQEHRNKKEKKTSMTKWQADKKQVFKSAFKKNADPEKRYKKA